MNNQEQQINQTTTPEQKSKPKPKWFIPIIVIVGVIVLGLIVWGGYELFKPAPPEEPIIEDEFKDWKTYQNEEYGWEVRYPEDWRIPEWMLETSYEIEINSWKAGEYPPIQGNAPPGEAIVSINVLSPERRSNKSLQEYPKSQAICPPGCTLISEESTTFNGYESIKSIYATTFVGGQYIVAQYILKGNLIYELNLLMPEKNEEFIQLFNQILSTFKFLEIDETVKTIDIQGIKMSISDKWYIDRQTEIKAYIKTDYQPYNVFLVLDVKKNNQDDIKSFKEEKAGYDYTKIVNGEIFKVACGGALACNGAIINDDVYTFGWTIESDQTSPKDLEGIWVPDHNVKQEDIWDILKTIKTRSDETADWKTYQNEEHGWEAKYPDGWFTTECDGAKIVFFDDKAIDNCVPEKKLGKIAIQGSLSSIAINALLNTYTDLQEVDNFDRKDILINGEQAVRISGLRRYWIPDNPQPFLRYFDIVLLEREGQDDNLEIEYYEDDEDLDYLNIFNQILSTFKFFP